MSTKDDIVLEIKNLDITFKMATGDVHAIRGVNYKVRRNEVLALVGESGCGKSLSAKTIMGILPDNAVINSGEILYKYEGEYIDLLKKTPKWKNKNINGSKIAMIFQDPMTSLNPTMSIGGQLITAIRTNKKVSKQEAVSNAVELLEEVGITDPPRIMKSYPHQLSGGMRQRVVIAIALSGDPDILICDEPTTALDVTIQAKILSLIQNEQRTRGVSVIFITHNFGVVAKMADYIGVMYAGKIIETGTIVDIFYNPKHPYTWGLLSSVSEASDSDERLYTIPGTPPNLANEIVGDAFAPRNPYALNIDFKQEPPMFKISETHYAATWLADERAPKVKLPEIIEARINRMKKQEVDYVRSE